MKVSKTQAEAAYNVVMREIQKLRDSHYQNEFDNFKVNYPKEYSVMQTWVAYIESINTLYDANKDSRYCVISDFYRGATLDAQISSAVYRIISDKYEYPNRAEFIDNILLLGDTDIKAYIDKFMDKFK